MNENIVVAGQVWRPVGAPGVSWVVVGLRCDPFTHRDVRVYAQLVKVAAHDAEGHEHEYDRLELTCDDLREQAELIYDATLVEPYGIAA